MGTFEVGCRGLGGQDGGRMEMTSDDGKVVLSANFCERPAFGPFPLTLSQLVGYCLVFGIPYGVPQRLIDECSRRVCGALCERARMSVAVTSLTFPAQLRVRLTLGPFSLREDATACGTQRPDMPETEPPAAYIRWGQNYR